MATPKRTPRTRTQTQKDLADIKESLAERDALAPAERAAFDSRISELRERTADVTVEAAVTKLTDTGLSINKAIADVQATISAQVAELSQIREAIEVAKNDLAEIYGKEVAASALSQLVAEYDERKKVFEAQVAEVRESWLKEQGAHNQSISERNDLAQKNRVREEQDFVYQRDLKRRADQDAFIQQLADAKRAEQLRKETLEKSWAEREAALKAQEQEVASLKAKVEAFPSELDAAVKRAEAVVGSSVKREYEHKMALEAAGIAGEKKLLAQEVAAGKATIDRLQETIASLQHEITDTKKQVVEVAKQAMESASGRSALAAVHETLQTTQPANGTRKV